MATNHIDVQIVNSPEEAPHYRRDRIDVRSVTIERAIIVKKGTLSGKSTVDIQIKDEEGNEYVAMLTGALVQTLAEIVKGAEQRAG